MISEVNISAQRLAKNRVLAQYWSDVHRTFRNVSPTSEDTCKAFYFEIGALVAAGRPKTWKNESKTMILCKEVTFFGTSHYRKVGRTGWAIGEIYQVMVLRVSSESNLFKKTNHSTRKQWGRKKFSSNIGQLGEKRTEIGPFFTYIWDEKQWYEAGKRAKPGFYDMAVICMMVKKLFKQ